MRDEYVSKYFNGETSYPAIYKGWAYIQGQNGIQPPICVQVIHRVGALQCHFDPIIL